MKLGVVGSRRLTIHLEDFIPPQWLDGLEIISGGATGIDSCAAYFAKRYNYPITEYLPKYNLYGKSAPIIRNMQIINESDYLFIFWDGESKGTSFVLQKCQKLGKPYSLFKPVNGIIQKSEERAKQQEQEWETLKLY